MKSRYALLAVGGFGLCAGLNAFFESPAISVATIFFAGVNFGNWINEYFADKTKELNLRQSAKSADKKP